VRTLAQLNVALATPAPAERNTPEPLARRIHHVLADHLLHPQSALVGLDHQQGRRSQRDHLRQ
jgi:hypothetical protein